MTHATPMTWRKSTTAWLFAVVAAAGPGRAAFANPSGSVRCSTLTSNWRLITDHSPPLNRGLVAYALAHYGQTVGGGECTDIPDRYLRDAQAKTYAQLGPSGGDNVNYVWGNLVTTATAGHVDLSSVLPGDIIQMRNIWDQFQSGSTIWTQNPAHHTAIVFGISPDQRQVCVLEQGGTSIGYGWYNLNGLAAGTLWFYRPIY